MMAPIFQICAASPAVTALLGTSPTRLYQFGEAPQNTPAPYAVWQRVGGLPVMFLGQLPDVDSYTLQIDVYAPTPIVARNVAEALRDAIEPVAYIVGWGLEGRDQETRLHRIVFDVDWIVRRN
ncbi:DUF3168 domain-containing protein [Thermomonas sp.]|uniref:DUF3168 domain-containing protein n=1 Tax=Thermomonas sp. TaxID=1971895 RepID=UPI0026300A27|nr:DUF3168 domain-containing protein [Thermomonas sp.]